ncbi:RNA-directed DNA polymerase [Acinetobacter cumulans]|uniref:RNA-directed DNA polymerase n=1 Tax=Acinetobacter cumulans TaxID=2136182 RepID=A0ABX9U543_9GAMM|nr:reverse transcriptase family protein [Acinetobacter cumulans]QCO23016.1 RNA-directed DNA polymerase [Acinetobacter cumulans]QFU78771.1 RNA-directed DNA polymerase [Acinetobacter cumulans]RLL42523.1 RNA-directed DNA polymerase [Acinetobacter cumulans]
MSNKAKEWVAYFNDVGLQEAYINEYGLVVEKLLKNKVPVIFEIEHLSKLVGINVKTLYSMIFSPEKFYREFEIPKKKGGTRKINAPFKSLKKVQQWIYINILKVKNKNAYAHGFLDGKSIITNAREHINSSVFLHLDIKDFFSSIPIGWIVNFFYSLGYSKKISFYLSRLCCFKDCLVQGSSCSPALSNILLVNLDRKLNKYALKNNLKYSRYADDLVFSGNYISLSFRNFCSFLIKNYGFKINTKKTRLKVNASQNIITGIQIKGNILSVPKQYKRKLKQEIYYIEKYGFISHVNKKKIKNPDYLASLIGRVNFVLNVEPNNLEFTEYKKILSNLIQ